MQSISRTIYGVILAVLAIGLVIFGVQNTQAVRIQFLTFTSEQLSLSLVVIGAVILGAALMWLSSLLGAAQRGLQLRKVTKERMTLATRNVQLENRINALEQELKLIYPDRKVSEIKPAGKPATKK